MNHSKTIIQFPHSMHTAKNCISVFLMRGSDHQFPGFLPTRHHALCKIPQTAEPFLIKYHFGTSISAYFLRVSSSKLSRYASVVCRDLCPRVSLINSRTPSVTFHLLVGFPHHLLGNRYRLCLFFKNHP